MTLQDLLNKAKPYAIKTFEIIDRPISMRTVRREAEQMKSYFRTQQGAQTLLDFYFNAETSKIAEPAGTLHQGTFTFFETPKDRETLFYGLLNGDAKAFDELCEKIQRKISRQKNPAYSEVDTRVLAALNEYRSNGINHLRAVVYAQYHLSSSVPIPEDKPGIAIHIHPQRSSYFHEDGAFFINVAGYSDTDKNFALLRSLALIEYESSQENDALIVKFKLRHRYGFAEMPVQDYTLTAFLEPKAPIFMNGEGHVITLEKRAMRKSPAMNALSSSSNLWPLIEIQAESKRTDTSELKIASPISTKEEIKILAAPELEPRIRAGLEEAEQLTESAAQKLYDLTWNQKQ